MRRRAQSAGRVDVPLGSGRGGISCKRQLSLTSEGIPHSRVGCGPLHVLTHTTLYYYKRYVRLSKV